MTCVHSVSWTMISKNDMTLGYDNLNDFFVCHKDSYHSSLVIHKSCLNAVTNVQGFVYAL